MRKISTLDEFEQLVIYIMGDETDLFSSIKDMEANLDFFKVYDQIIELISNHLSLEITFIDIPFLMKFDIVISVINKIQGNDGITAFLQTIYSIPFDSDSELLTAIKNDYRACIFLVNFGPLLNQYEYPYHLLNHVHENINNIFKNDYSLIIRDISFFLDSLGGIIQKKLYNDESEFLNHELIDFTFSFIQITHTKKEDTLTYRRLLAEYPDILKVYELAVTTLNRLKTRNSILI